MVEQKTVLEQAGNTPVKDPLLKFEGGELTIENLSFAYTETKVLSNISLTVEAGKSIALLGPSGSGKTTLLRLIAGLEQAKEGRISLDNYTLSDQNKSIPTEQRNIGMVFQEGALFPHMDVETNVAFGLKKAPDREAHIEKILELVGLPGYGKRYPETLSGGERQRVALARALAPKPSVLLLDEPFASIDPKLRAQLRSDVSELLSELKITSIFVTHDLETAFVVGNKIAVMNEAKILQFGTADEIYKYPATQWVAEFVGEANFFKGQATGTEIETILGKLPLAKPSNGALNALVRPEHISLADGKDWKIEKIEFYGHDTRYLISKGDHALVSVRTPLMGTQRTGDFVDLKYTGPPTQTY